MKLNIKSIGILLALTFSTKVNANVTSSSKVVPSKTLSTVTVSSKTIPTLTTTNTVTTKIPPMITTTVVFMPKYLEYDYDKYKLKVPNNVEKVLVNCDVYAAKALPTSICDKKSTCFGKYTTFTVRHYNVLSTVYNNLCEVFTHKSNEPTPTTGYMSTDLCTPVITTSTYDKIFTVNPRSTTTKFGEEGYYTEYATYTVYPTSYPTEWVNCNSYATSTVKMIPRDIKTTTGKTIPTTTTTGKTIPTTTTTTGKTIPTTTTTTGKTIPTTTTTTGKTIPTTTTTSKTIPTTTTTSKNVPFISTTVTYYASATPGYEIFFNTTVIEVPATVKKVQMNCSYYRSSKTVPRYTYSYSVKTVTPVTLNRRALSSSYPQEKILSNNVESNYYDSCNNYYGIYTTLPFTIREKGSCTVLTHNGNEKLAQKSTSICAPALKTYYKTIKSLVDSYTTTLEVVSKTTVIEKATTYKSTSTISYYNIVCNYCPTSQPLTTTTSTTTTKTTTTTTSSSTISTTTTSSTPTSSFSVTTSITSTKCLPVYVTVTEKEKVTVTEKETITVTVKSSSNPTIIDNDDDRKCADKWAQCGGVGFTGPTCCKQGYHCHELNQYYSQCI